MRVDVAGGLARVTFDAAVRESAGLYMDIERALDRAGYVGKPVREP